MSGYEFTKLELIGIWLMFWGAGLLILWLASLIQNKRSKE
jgi:hypothetical protein